jgi:hypothetical protein
VPANLHAIAQLLRQADHLDPEAQKAVADLVDEMARRLAPAASTETAQLADSTAHLLQALHDQQDARAMMRARGRLEQAIVNAEARAPVAAGLAQRILDALASWGI